MFIHATQPVRPRKSATVTARCRVQCRSGRVRARGPRGQRQRTDDRHRSTILQCGLTPVNRLCTLRRSAEAPDRWRRTHARTKRPARAGTPAGLVRGHRHRRSLQQPGRLDGAERRAPTTAAERRGAQRRRVAERQAKTLEIAYLSFAVANSYDAPMLAAAQAAAAAGNAKLTVFDANLDPAQQTKQLQDAVASGKYDAIITQPLYGPAWCGRHAAIDAGIAIGNIDQILGTDNTTAESQIPGMMANVAFVPSTLGRKIGELVVAACAEKAATRATSATSGRSRRPRSTRPCGQAFDEVTASHPEIKVVAEGESFYTTALGLKAAQDMLQAHPDLTVIVGADQAITGAVQAVGPDKGQDRPRRLRRRRDRPAGHQERPALRHGHADARDRRPPRHRTAHQRDPDRDPGAGMDPLDSLPEGGVVTKANVETFLPLAEWPG